MKFKNQKTILKAYIMIYGGFLISVISFIYIYIYANIFHSRFGSFPVIVLFIFVFLGISLMIFSSKYNIMFLNSFRHFFIPTFHGNENGWFIQGVPNNPRINFLLSYSELINQTDIHIYELDKGIFYTNINDKKLVFDMRGWLRKKYYIYEILMTIISLSFKKSEKNIHEKIPNIDLNFYNNKHIIKKYKLIYKGLPHKNILFKYRYFRKYSILSSYNRKGKIDINKLYHFN